MTTPNPPGAIRAVPAGAHRPFWSVMIPTYDPNPDFLARGLAAVLAQDPGPEVMEIVLVDDGSSTVDPRDCIPAHACDRVGWVPQEHHVGIGANWNTCIDRARGQWVHILHQDDLVLHGFYDRLRAGITSSPTAGAAFCRDVVIDAYGEPIGWQRLIRTTPGIVDDWIDHVFVGLDLRASALVVKRSLYEALGGFRLDLHYALDWDMWKRIAAAYPLWYDPEPLACYRRHSASASGSFIRSGANIVEIARSIALSESLLPSATAPAISKRARANYTRYAVGIAQQALATGELRAAIAQLREGRRLTSAFVVIREIVRRLGH